MTKKSDAPKDIERPREVQPIPETQRGGVIGDTNTQANWRETQQAHMLALDESATNLYYKSGQTRQAAEKFQLFDGTTDRKLTVAQPEANQMDTSEMVAQEARTNQEAEPVGLFRKWVAELPPGANKSKFEELAMEETANLSPALKARIKGKRVGCDPELEEAGTHQALSPNRLQGRVEHRHEVAPEQPEQMLTNTPDGWLTAGQRIAALPLESQAKIAGIGLAAGVEQYQNDERERLIGAMIGSVQGVGNVAVNLAKIADFSAYCIIGDKELARELESQASDTKIKVTLLR